MTSPRGQIALSLSNSSMPVGGGFETRLDPNQDFSNKSDLISARHTGVKYARQRARGEAAPRRRNTAAPGDNSRMRARSRAPRSADDCELVSDMVGRPDKGKTADRVRGKISALCRILVRRNRLRRDAFVRQHSVDRAPVCILDDGMAVIVLRFLLCGPADHLADCVDSISRPISASSVLDLRRPSWRSPPATCASPPSQQRMHRSCAMQRLGRRTRTRRS